MMGIEELRTATGSGDIAASVALGTLLLTGRDAPFEPEEGARLIAAAAEKGDGQALSVLATLRAAGAWTHQSWPEALDLLGRAAEAGARDAREQLVLLAGDAALVRQVRDGAAAPDVWKRLRDSIDLEKWIVPQPPKQVFDWPKIWIAE